MKKAASACLAMAVTALVAPVSAQTPTYFVPLTESAPVVPTNALEETTAPWVTPSGVIQTNLMSMDEVESSIYQSIVRVPAGNVSSMFDMLAFDPSGENIFIPHETPIGAGLSRYNVREDFTQVVFAGDQGGANGDWSNDYGAFDPARWTPHGRVWVAEEWTAEGRVIEVVNPYTRRPGGARIREVESIANVSHEGSEFGLDDPRVVYYVDEWNSGAIYKFVSINKNYRAGQTFVLQVLDFKGNAEDLWNDPSNVGQPRTGLAHWVPITNKTGKQYYTPTDPFRNGPTNDPRTNDDTRGGRKAADEAYATPYGRPEDTVLKKLANGNTALFFCRHLRAHDLRRRGAPGQRIRDGEGVCFRQHADEPRLRAHDRLAQLARQPGARRARQRVHHRGCPQQLVDRR